MSKVKKMRPWQIANTTVRNPRRLRIGLEALVKLGYEGNMDRELEEEMAIALHDAGVISLSSSTRDITSIARKWRNALEKLGFIRPDVSKHKKTLPDARQDELGLKYTITDNGRRLLAAKSLQAEQEIMLRALAALQLPSPLEPRYDFATFFPLFHVIKILLKLSEGNFGAYLTRVEMASIVILTSDEDEIDEIVARIADLRRRRSQSDKKRAFDRDQMNETSKVCDTKAATLFDYQDVVFRYLKSTGLFQSYGRGIALMREKIKLAELLVADPPEPLVGMSYLKRLGHGARLPTDSFEGANAVVDDLLSMAHDRGLAFDVASYPNTSASDLSLVRYELEQLIFDDKEIQFARRQRSEFGEILAYLQLLDSNANTIEYKGEELVIPRDERPAYFEWLLWRVLLALNDLEVGPKDVRRFGIDQEFLPVGTAPGGGPDLIGVYADSVIVVEVTLTESSRQEAAEGEPVRRHVADVLEEFEAAGKAVYGLFVARRIDTNTAETFRIGVWYKKDDARVSLDVVPLTLKQLRKILSDGWSDNRLDVSILIDVILAASRARRMVDCAPDWKEQISSIVG